jgi:hypothetical protein
MTVRYNFEPILLGASPIPSRFAAPLDESAGGVTWLDGEPRTEEYRPGRVVLSLSLRDIDLLFRARRGGQRPAGMPRSAWWRLPRRERRQIGGAP